jgi:hypothetical protein
MADGAVLEALKKENYDFLTLALRRAILRQTTLPDFGFAVVVYVVLILCHLPWCNGITAYGFRQSSEGCGHGRRAIRLSVSAVRSADITRLPVR